MGFVDMQCPKCGAKIREKCNAWAYGSPIKSCPKCGSEFIDKRFREVAVEGFDTRSTDPVLYLKGFGLFLAFTTVCAVLLVFMINFMGGYPTKLVGCLVCQPCLPCPVYLHKARLGGKGQCKASGGIRKKAAK